MIQLCFPLVCCEVKSEVEWSRVLAIRDHCAVLRTVGIYASQMPVDMVVTELLADWYGNYVAYLLCSLRTDARELVAGFMNRVRRLQGVFHLNGILSELCVNWQAAGRLECARSLIGNVKLNVRDVEGVDRFFQVRPEGR